MDAGEAPKRKRLSADARRRLIVDAARDVFLENGQAGGRLRDIAERAGITEAYLYRYFTSKSELYHAAVTEPLERLLDGLDAEVSRLMATSGLTGVEVLHEINEIMLNFMVSAVPYLGVALFSDMALEDSFYKTTLYPRAYERTRAVLACIKGWPDRQLDLEVVNNAMWSLNYGIALDAFLRGADVDVPRVAKRVTQLYVVGVPELRAGAGGR